MIELVLILVSHLCKKVFSLIFFLYGCFMASIRWELKAYLKEVAIINDVYLNVVGKYALNQALCHEPVFGNRLQTVSAAMAKARLHKFGMFWHRFVEWLEKDHFKKADENHVKAISAEHKKILMHD